jgi:hypothetical protein
MCLHIGHSVTFGNAFIGPSRVQQQPAVRWNAALKEAARTQHSSFMEHNASLLKSCTGAPLRGSKGTRPSCTCPHSRSRILSCTGTSCGCSQSSSPPCGRTLGTVSNSLTGPGQTHRHLRRSAASWEAFRTRHSSSPAQARINRCNSTGSNNSNGDRGGIC